MTTEEEEPLMARVVWPAAAIALKAYSVKGLGQLRTGVD